MLESKTELDDLCTDMCDLRRQAFPKKLQTKIQELLTEFSSAEIVEAWRQYTEPMTDDELKYAPKKFCEGAGEQFAKVARRQIERSKAQSALIETLLQRERDAVASEVLEDEGAIEDVLGVE